MPDGEWERVCLGVDWTQRTSELPVQACGFFCAQLSSMAYFLRQSPADHPVVRLANPDKLDAGMSAASSLAPARSLPAEPPHPGAPAGPMPVQEKQAAVGALQPVSPHGHMLVEGATTGLRQGAVQTTRRTARSEAECSSGPGLQGSAPAGSGRFLNLSAARDKRKKATQARLAGRRLEKVQHSPKRASSDAGGGAAPPQSSEEHIKRIAHAALASLDGVEQDLRRRAAARQASRQGGRQGAYQVPAIKPRRRPRAQTQEATQHDERALEAASEATAHISVPSAGGVLAADGSGSVQVAALGPKAESAADSSPPPAATNGDSAKGPLEAPPFDSSPREVLPCSSVPDAAEGGAVVAATGQVAGSKLTDAAVTSKEGDNASRPKPPALPEGYRLIRMGDTSVQFGWSPFMEGSDASDDSDSGSDAEEAFVLPLPEGVEVLSREPAEPHDEAGGALESKEPEGGQVVALIASPHVAEGELDNEPPLTLEAMGCDVYSKAWDILSSSVTPRTHAAFGFAVPQTAASAQDSSAAGRSADEDGVQATTPDQGTSVLLQHIMAALQQLQSSPHARSLPWLAGKAAQRFAHSVALTLRPLRAVPSVTHGVWKAIALAIVVSQPRGSATESAPTLPEAMSAVLESVHSTFSLQQLKLLSGTVAAGVRFMSEPLAQGALHRNLGLTPGAGLSPAPAQGQAGATGSQTPGEIGVCESTGSAAVRGMSRAEFQALSPAEQEEETLQRMAEARRSLELQRRHTGTAQ